MASGYMLASSPSAEQGVFDLFGEVHVTSPLFPGCAENLVAG